jgi:flagellar biosynthesis component FlhA
VILQACAESGAKLTERGLVAEMRVALAPVISASVAERFTIYGAVLDPLLDLALARAEETESLLPQEIVQEICSQVESITDGRVVVMASRRARAYLRDLLRIRGISRSVIAHEEVAARYDVVQVGRIEVNDHESRSVILESLAA